MATDPVSTTAPAPSRGLDMRYIGPDPQAAPAQATAAPKKRAALWVVGAGLAVLALKVVPIVLHLGVFAHLFHALPHPGK